jgi:hypothetical protein
MMAYGSDISQGGDYSEIAFSLSNPNTAASLYTLNDYSYDIAINGSPFFLVNSDENPYRRVTAQYRKQQYDQTREAGEQSLTGWWFRSQSSFHLGQGIKFFEPAQDESLRFQYTESKGCDVWTRGQVTLLNSTLRASSSTNTNLKLLGAYQASTGTNAAVFIDGPDLKKLTMSTDTPTVTTYTLVTSPHTLDFKALASDGTRYFAADNARIHRGNIFGTTSDGHIYDLSGPVTTVVLKYAKQRLIACVDRKVYELNSNISTTPGGNSLPAELYTHPNPSWIWTTAAEGPGAFYVGGYADASSSLYKITIDVTTTNALGFPTLNAPTVVIDLPEGEIIQAFDVYLGTYAVLCTNYGTRIGVVNDNGDISYGPLLFSGDCKAVTFDDKFAYVTTLVDGESGLIRIDLSEPIVSGSLLFPYAWDVYAIGETAIPLSTDFLGITDRVLFTVPGDGVWITSNSTKVASGYLQTGYIRYNTLEDKIFKFITPRVDTLNGAFEVLSIGETGTEYAIGGYAQGAGVSELGVPYPVGNHEYLGFKFTLNRSSSDSSKGPLFTGYQLKSLPAVLRQRLIQYPLACYDHESDSLNNEVGYDGRAFDRLSQLESIENLGDTVRVQDFRTGETFIGLIEEMDFRNVTPTDKRFSGFGGVLIVTIRTV